MNDYIVSVARDYNEGDLPKEEFMVKAKCREEALRKALAMIGLNDRIFSVINSENSGDRLDGAVW